MGILALLAELADSGIGLARNSVRMAASEMRVVLHRIAVQVGALLAGLLLAGVGLLLALGGVALVLSREFGIDLWAALAATGATTLTVGALVAARAVRRLGEQDVALPETLAEIDRDVEAIRAPRSSAARGRA